MKATDVRKTNLHVWAYYSPIAKRTTRKGKVIFTIDDEKYITNGRFEGVDEFNRIIDDYLNRDEDDQE